MIKLHVTMFVSEGFCRHPLMFSWDAKCTYYSITPEQTFSSYSFSKGGWGVWLEREIISEPVDSTPPSAQVRQNEGIRFVLVATKEEVIPSLPLLLDTDLIPSSDCSHLLPPSHGFDKVFLVQWSQSQESYNR